MRRRRILGGVRVACAVTVALLHGVQAPAQEVTESALKAAFIYNFAKFTEWPGDLLPATAPLVICVLGDKVIADALERSIPGRVIGDHPLRVSRVEATGPFRACHILYLTHVPAVQAAQIVAGLQDASVLTISDMEGFNALGGITQLYTDRGKLSFSVHLESAKRARLQISSRVLVLTRKQ